MEKQSDRKKYLYNKIEVIRKLLYKKIEENSDKEQIQHISEILDKLIVDYLRE